MSAFDPSSFSSGAFSGDSFDLQETPGSISGTCTGSSTASGTLTGVEVSQVIVGGGLHFGYVSTKRQSKEERIKERERLGIIPAEIAKVATSAVAKAIEQRTIADEGIDLALAEKAMREELKALHRRWLKKYIQILAVEYARQEQEREDAQIAMLLFEM